MTARTLAGYSEYLREVMRVQEKAYLREFDSIVVFSDEDKRALSGWLEDDKVHVSPFPIASGSETRDDSREARFSFVGSEEHFPNRDALEWLTEEIGLKSRSRCRAPSSGSLDHGVKPPGLAIPSPASSSLDLSPIWKMLLGEALCSCRFGSEAVSASNSSMQWLRELRPSARRLAAKESR